MSTRRVNSWAVALAVFALGAGAACERPGPREAAERPAAGVETERPSDTRITTSIQGQYYLNEDIRGRRVDVTSQDGVVTLRGEVGSEAARQEALRIAGETEGVTRVEDQLQVREATTAETARREEPPAVGTAGRDAEGRVQPAWITTKIQAQYYMNPDIRPWNIDVTTRSDGVVTLSGEVENAEDKAEAVRIARETEGVTRVEDELRVRGEAEPAERETAREGGGIAGMMEQPDAWITTKIQAKYFVDGDVQMRNINVTTEEGVVTLRGTVLSEAERRQAVALARNTDGVRDVRDELQVQPEAETPERRDTGRQVRETGRGTATTVEDAWITTKIQSKYFLDGDVKAREINVDTRSGVVTLKGAVDNESERRLAEQIARDTEGVVRVVNQLTIQQAR